MTEENKDVVSEEQETQAILQIQRIYVKDVSFEAPNLPHIFNQEWKPKLTFESKYFVYLDEYGTDHALLLLLDYVLKVWQAEIGKA